MLVNIIHPMNLKQLILEEIENYDYRGDHSAPSKDDAPLYDLSKLYPDDLYTSNEAARYYGDGDYNNDWISINIIRSVKNRPNKLVKIYRAVPDFNKEINKKIKTLNDILYYHDKFGFFPMKNSYIDSIRNNLPEVGENFTYEQQQIEIFKQIRKDIDDLILEKQKPIKINPGDWVTINYNYAKEHGYSNLNNKYKIITKTVPAKTLYNEGNSVYEFGYNP